MTTRNIRCPHCDKPIHIWIDVDARINKVWHEKKKHYCLNQVMEGDYECEVCNS